MALTEPCWTSRIHIGPEVELLPWFLELSTQARATVLSDHEKDLSTACSTISSLSFLIQYITQAKILVQQLWSKQRDWDDPDLPADLQAAWEAWEKELPSPQSISIPWYYTKTDRPNVITHDLHVFCNASEWLLICSVSMKNATLALSWPGPELSIPHLELCGALAGAQLALPLQKELSIYFVDRFHHCSWMGAVWILPFQDVFSCKSGRNSRAHRPSFLALHGFF